MTGSELVAVPDFSLLHDFCHGLLGSRIQHGVGANRTDQYVRKVLAETL